MVPLKISQNHRKTPVLESLFNEAAVFQHRRFPVNSAKFFKNTYLVEHSERLLLVSSWWSWWYLNQEDIFFFNFSMWLELLIDKLFHHALTLYLQRNITYSIFKHFNDWKNVATKTWKMQRHGETYFGTCQTSMMKLIGD